MKVDFHTLAQRPAEAGPFIPDRCRVQPARHITCSTGPMGGIWFRCELFTNGGEGYGAVLAFPAHQPPTMETLLAVLKLTPDFFGRIV